MTKKTAVVLYGFLRTYEKTAFSLIKHIIHPNNADLFIFAPNRSGVINDSWYEENAKLNNKDHSLGNTISEEDVVKNYKGKLTKLKLWEYDKEMFNKDELKNIPIIAHINPTRIVSMFYHIENALKLVEQYEKEHHFKYDYIILSRPDIAFYSDIKTNNCSLESISVSSTIGYLDKKTGQLLQARAPVMFWKNVILGEMLEAEKYHFNDPIIISDRKNFAPLFSIYKNVPQFVQIGLPFNPETILFYLLCFKQNLSLKFCDDWQWEIFRSNHKEIMGIYDLDHYDWFKEKKGDPKTKNIGFKKLYLMYLVMRYMSKPEKFKEKLVKYNFI